MEAGAKPKTYEPDEVEAKLKEHGLDDWYLEGDWIRRKYNTDGWPSTLMAVNAVGYVCEAAYHHADLAVTWGKLWVKLQNHAAGGITDKDFAVARQIEDTVLWRPADDSPLEGTPNKFVFSKGGRQADARSRYGARDIRVFAEINGVQRLEREQIVAAASYYRDAGADVIDLGLSLDRDWLDEGPEAIADLKARGFALSIDTLDPDQILMADAAGVDYVLSLNGHNRHVAQQLRATPVLVPDTPDDLDSLDATVAHLQELGKPFLVDPIIEPIGFGFAASLGRYIETRRRHPDVEMLMGIGNMTELTEADTTGVTALLIGFCQELGIRNVLTTEVIDWARGAVREAVLAAQLMHFALEEGTPPKHVDGRLLTIKDEEVRPYTEAELRELHASITDPNIRIFTDADWIYAFNAEHFVKGTDINEIFDRLGVDEHTHAFYLGKELMKAAIARGLGKK